MALCALGAAATATACSGPGTLELMKGVEQSAYVAAAICAFILVVSFLLGRWLSAATSGVLFAIHPAWTMSPYKGDCGGMAQMFTFAATAIILSVFLWDLLRRKPAAGGR